MPVPQRDTPIFGPSAADPPVKRQPASQPASQPADPQVGRSVHSRNSRGRESPLPYIQKRFHVSPFIAIFAVEFSYQTP